MSNHRLPLVALALVCLSSLGAQTLLVSAAASLTDVLRDLGPEAEKAVGAKLQFNFGGSGSLRKQIEEGAPVDLFFSADGADMDRLEAASLLVPNSRIDLLSNAIVLVGEARKSPAPNQAAKQGWDSATLSKEELAALLAGTSLLAVGNPDTVPAGRYALEALRGLGLFSLVEGRLALGGSVREVLQFVQTGSAPLGIVFLTDALSARAGPPLSILYAFPPSALSTPIRYPIAIVAASRNAAKAAALIAFLRSPRAMAAFESAGFARP